MVVATETDGVDAVEEPVVSKVTGLITLEILKIISDSQQQHGLRHSDFQRYRGYCTRRIRRLRKSLRLTQGDKRHYKRRDVIEAHLIDESYLYIPLMLAERAWGYAMQLRQESNTEPRKRFHLISKMKKAVAYAEDLESLCQSEACDARSKLEAQAYLSWLKGTFYFELKAYKEAMDNLQQAKVVYEKLSALVDENDQAVYKGKCEDLVPSLRYCSYSIGDDSAISDLKSLQGAAQGDMLDTLDRLMVDARLKAGGTKKEVSWRGKPIPVSIASVSSFLVAEEEMPQAIEEPTQANIDQIERHIINCKDAIASVRDEINALKSKAGSSEAASVKSLQLLMSYLTHIRLSRSNQRTLLMIAKLSEDENKKAKPQDFIRLYELILQNLTEMQNLPGVEDDEDYQSTLESSTAAYKAFRCYYIAEALMAAKKFREALALYQKAATYCTSVKASTGHLEQLKEIRIKSDSAKSSCLARAILQEADESKSQGAAGGPLAPFESKKVASKLPLIDCLDVYSEDPKLATKSASIVRLPPDMRPIPAKPLYFDVAMNHLTLPSVDSILDSSKRAKAGGPSLTGFVKGLWGWGGK
ncbi:unnamed protein product [Nesidiocoris tenuis]|uniref:Signal recognition particle SEC65 subunit n=2 Tax=Nesidiocoris tenuis TaxID=355587 RepID=A0ABN7AXW6_9HEMI|nr:Signal recognition particle SEC65 subunit [Nesidiocoris tenuis]CAA9994535.1 unnamed protein product [Nesidiocoris tenuis]